MRPFAWVAVVLLALAWFAMPASEPAAVAVQRIPELLQARIEGGEGSLAELMISGGLDQPAVEPAPELARVAIAGVRLVVPGQGSADLTIHGRARRALVGALRETARRKGLELEVEGERRAVEGGWSVLFSLQNEKLSASIRRERGPSTGISIAARASDRLALLPALIAIALVLLSRRPLVALFSGLAAGAGLLHSSSSTPDSTAWDAYPGQFARMLFEEMRATESWKPLATLLVLLAAWAVTARNGGLGGWTAWLSARAANARRAQLAVWLASLCLFFVAPQKNALLGWSLRTLAVRARVSAEKLAWLLDSTGTAVLGLCALSPLVAMAFSFAAGQGPSGLSAGELWLATLPWRGFCWLSLGLGFLVLQSGRDFGPMLAAERRCREGLGANAPGARRVFAAPEPDPRTAHHPWRAAAPILTYVLALLAQTLRTRGAGFQGSQPDSWIAWGASASASDAHWIAALAALLVALAMSAVGGAERGVPAACLYGLRAALRPALLIGVAWALGVVSERLGAVQVLCAGLGDAIAPQTLPAALFLLSLAAAFCFGSALAILPLLLSTACGLCGALGMDFAGGAAQLNVLGVAAVLEGSLAGALLSPLSASSLSASIGAGADHGDHVRTQAPYALLTAVSALIFGFLPAGLFGVGPWTAMALGAIVHLAVFAWLSRASERRAV